MVSTTLTSSADHKIQLIKGTGRGAPGSNAKQLKHPAYSQDLSKTFENNF